MFHSYSMINEPIVHQDLYTDAVVIMTAQTKEEALDLLAKKDGRWLVEELRRLEQKSLIVVSRRLYLKMCVVTRLVCA